MASDTSFGWMVDVPVTGFSPDGWRCTAIGNIYQELTAYTFTCVVFSLSTLNKTLLLVPMKLLNIARQFLEGFTAPWWVEITTDKPKCLYYFGEFTTKLEARAATPGYVEDLNGEGAQGIKVALKRCQPEQLTVCDGDQP